MRRIIGALVLVLAAAVAAETLRTEVSGLRFSVPKTWTRVPALSDMAAAQYTLPRAPGDLADGELVLYTPGEGKPVNVEETLQRWYGQFAQSDGRSSREVASVTTRTVNGLRVTAVDLAGTYVGTSAGTNPAGVSGFRMLAAIVEGPGGPWFFRAVGPAGSIAQAKGDFDALLASLEPHR
jgi:hypothetical protein